MTIKLTNGESFFGAREVRVSPWALSVALLVASAIWVIGAGGCYAASDSMDGWSQTPLVWLATLMVVPSVCFALSIVLVNVRRQSSLSWFDWCALAGAFFPVSLGSLLAILEVDAIFWPGFQEAAIGFRIFGVVACLALAAISGGMIWKAARNYLSGRRPEERRVV